VVKQKVRVVVDPEATEATSDIGQCVINVLNISQGSVATLSRCGGMTKNSLPSHCK